MIFRTLEESLSELPSTYQIGQLLCDKVSHKPICLFITAPKKASVRREINGKKQLFSLSEATVTPPFKTRVKFILMEFSFCYHPAKLMYELSSKEVFIPLKTRFSLSETITILCLLKNYKRHLIFFTSSLVWDLSCSWATGRHIISAFWWARRQQE